MFRYVKCASAVVFLTSMHLHTMSCICIHIYRSAKLPAVMPIPVDWPRMPSAPLAPAATSPPVRYSRTGRRVVGGAGHVTLPSTAAERPRTVPWTHTSEMAAHAITAATTASRAPARHAILSASFTSVSTPHSTPLHVYNL